VSGYLKQLDFLSNLAKCRFLHQNSRPEDVFASHQWERGIKVKEKYAINKERAEAQENECNPNDDWLSAHSSFPERALEIKESGRSASSVSALGSR